MTELQDLIAHLPLIVSGQEGDTELFHIHGSTKESYSDWLKSAQAYYDEEDDLSERVVESLSNYELRLNLDYNERRLKLPNGDTYTINLCYIWEWY